MGGPGDNLANAWGTAYILFHMFGRPSRYKNKNIYTTNGFQETEKSKYWDKINSILHTATNDAFELFQVFECGSQANSGAFLDVCPNMSQILVCQGAYVAGNGTAHQWLSTSKFDPQGWSLTGIHSPAEVVSKFAKQQVIPLPFHVQMQPDDPSMTLELRNFLDRYEDACLDVVHLRCCAAMAGGYPIKALFLELMLAGNGASLSRRTLEKLAELSIHHDFTFIVDEIMTGGRTGTLLYAQQQPTKFLERVSHVTMGKWTGVGLLLKRYGGSGPWSLPIEDCQTGTRGASTKISLAEVDKNLEHVCEHQHMCSKRFKAVADYLGLECRDCWGAGALVFAPKGATASTMGLKNRFLPVLNDIPIAKGLKSVAKPHYQKAFVNKMIVNGTLEWTHHRPSLPNTNSTFLRFLEGVLNGDYLERDLPKPAHQARNILQPFKKSAAAETMGVKKSAIDGFNSTLHEKRLVDGFYRKGKRREPGFILPKTYLSPPYHAFTLRNSSRQLHEDAPPGYGLSVVPAHVLQAPKPVIVKPPKKRALQARKPRPRCARTSHKSPKNKSVAK